MLEALGLSTTFVWLMIVVTIIIHATCAIVAQEVADDVGRRTEGFWVGLVYGFTGVLVALLMQPRPPRQILEQPPKRRRSAADMAFTPDSLDIP